LGDERARRRRRAATAMCNKLGPNAASTELYLLAFVLQQPENLPCTGHAPTKRRRATMRSTPRFVLPLIAAYLVGCDKSKPPVDNPTAANVQGAIAKPADPIVAPKANTSPADKLPASMPNWAGDPEVSKQLEPYTRAANFQIRPPKGYKLSQQTSPQGLSLSWKGPLDGEYQPEFTAVVASLSPRELQSANLPKLMTENLTGITNGLKQGFSNVTTQNKEYGRIQGQDFARAIIKATDTKSGTKLAGFTYVTLQDGKAISFVTLEPETESKHLKLVEAAVLSYKPAKSDKPK